jgi:hypothetical protein
MRITQIPGVPLAKGVGFPLNPVFLEDTTFKQNGGNCMEMAPTITTSENVRDLRKLSGHSVGHSISKGIVVVCLLQCADVKVKLPHLHYECGVLFPHFVVGVEIVDVFSLQNSILVSPYNGEQ